MEEAWVRCTSPVDSVMMGNSRSPMAVPRHTQQGIEIENIQVPLASHTCIAASPLPSLKATPDFFERNFTRTTRE